MTLTRSTGPRRLIGEREPDDGVSSREAALRMASDELSGPPSGGDGPSDPSQAEASHAETGSAAQSVGAFRELALRGAPVSLLTPVLGALRTVFIGTLGRRILSLNLVALGMLLFGILYLNQFRAGLIDARMESLMVQGRIIAAAIAGSATVEPGAVELAPGGEAEAPAGDPLAALDTAIRPELVAPLLRSLLLPTQTRARIYGPDGILLFDSRDLYTAGPLLREDLDALTGEPDGMIAFIGKLLNRWFRPANLDVVSEDELRRSEEAEVRAALTGSSSRSERLSDRGEAIVSVVVPVQRFRTVQGALNLSTQGGVVDRIVAEERIQILRVFLYAGVVIVGLSLLLAWTMAAPIRRLSDAAQKVRREVKSRGEIPDFPGRRDEIGRLARSVREMTEALYARIEAIESFAADVSHELKNPLTSLRSAVETLPLARNDNSRARLMEIIQHDVKRLDRLITDISDASRLDAELARQSAEPVDLLRLLDAIVAMREAVRPDGREVAIHLDVIKRKARPNAYRVWGHEGRLAQVVNNLLDNARSFAPASGGRIDIRLRRIGEEVMIVVEDNGPGIRAEKVERVFERFYTDRPEGEGFGNNSGLGLSISKQIIEAHDGTITAENVELPDTGARFVIRLPAAPER